MKQVKTKAIIKWHRTVDPILGNYKRTPRKMRYHSLNLDINLTLKMCLGDTEEQPLEEQENGDITEVSDYEPAVNN
jgi:hypothetical protein